MIQWTICDDRPNLVKVDNRLHRVSFTPAVSNRLPRCPRCKTDRPEHFLETPSLKPELKLDWDHEDFTLVDCLLNHEILCQNCGLRHGELWRPIKLDEIHGDLPRWNPYQIVHPVQFRARAEKIEQIRNPQKNSYPVASHFHLKQMTSFKSYEAFLASFRGIHLFMSPAEQAEVQSWLEAKFEGLRGLRKREAEIIAKSFGKPVTSFSLEEDIATELAEAGL